MYSLYLVQVMTTVEKNMERKNILCDPCKKTYLYISALMIPGLFELWMPVTCQFRYMQVRRRPQVFLCAEDVWKFMLFLAFPFAVKFVYKRKVSCASKADTVDNPGAVICIARFIWHVQFTALLLFGNNRSDKQRFCQEIVTSERKANDHNYNQCMQSNDNLQGNES